MSVTVKALTAWAKLPGPCILKYTVLIQTSHRKYPAAIAWIKPAAPEYPKWIKFSQA